MSYEEFTKDEIIYTLEEHAKKNNMLRQAQRYLGSRSLYEMAKNELIEMLESFITFKSEVDVGIITYEKMGEIYPKYKLSINEISKRRKESKSLFARTKNMFENSKNKSSKSSTEIDESSVLRYNPQTITEAKENSIFYFFWNENGSRKAAMTTKGKIGINSRGFVLEELLNNYFIYSFRKIPNSDTSCVRILRYDFSSHNEKKYFMYAIRDMYKELDVILENKYIKFKSEDIANIKLAQANIMAFILNESAKLNYDKIYKW